MQAAGPVPGLEARGEQWGEARRHHPPSDGLLTLLSSLDAKLGAAALDADGERLPLDPVLVMQKLAIALGQRQDDPVGQVEAGVLAQRVDAVDQVAGAALQLELLVQGEVERDREAVLAGDGPAFLAVTLDQHLVGAEVVAVDAEPSVAQLLEVTRLERRSHRAELL